MVFFHEEQKVVSTINDMSHKEYFVVVTGYKRCTGETIVPNNITMHTPQSVYKSGERALSKAMEVMLDEGKTMAMPEMQKLVLLREVQKLHVQQSGMRSMIEGCAVLDDELAKWRDECKKAARLILFVCEGGHWGEENRDQSSPEIGSPYDMWPEFAQELAVPLVDGLEEEF